VPFPQFLPSPVCVKVVSAVFDVMLALFGHRTRNSSADEIANVNFLRRHRTRTTKYKKEDNSKQLNSHNKVHVRYKLHEMTQARVDAGYIVFSDVCQLLMMMMTTTMMMMDGCLCEHSLEPERKNYCRRPRAETCRS